MKEYEMLVTGKFYYLTNVRADDMEEAKVLAREDFNYDSKIITEKSEPEYYIEFEPSRVRENG